jgi:hypothetical protein
MAYPKCTSDTQCHSAVVFSNAIVVVGSVGRA